ncbi:hypothetical protein [Plastoroseomonas hellenica]|uniref:hypothetical protein n=1 Tax=Plastoroseomonas hellenica TaxID=2687306 RepID=UPI001BA500B2|nr:hypothetical protein [Plastoroseomonas hellenica]MBR0647538.1 hypothetical protein [Plastoroseomonas hellenica]
MALVAADPDAGLDRGLITEGAMRSGTVTIMLERMGFERCLGPLPRGGVAAFDGLYLRPDPMARARVRRQHGAAQAARFAEARWAEAASLNRSLAAHPVVLLARDRAPATAVWFDIVSGAWRHTSGGQSGEDIVTLGAVMWRCRIGQAAWRCAQILRTLHARR